MLKLKIFPHVSTHFIVANGGLLGASTLVRRVASRVPRMNDAWTLKAVLGGDVRRRLRPRLTCLRARAERSGALARWYVQHCRGLIDEEGDRSTPNPATFSNTLQLRLENKIMFITILFGQMRRHTDSLKKVVQSRVRLHTSRSRGGWSRPPHSAGPRHCSELPLT